ncbi:MAG TPA: fumarylacetoacetate hydrolase family protein [Pseudonocardiaceae bacterium]
MIDARVVADRLIEAERSRTPLRPFTHSYPFLDTETAYKAQWHVVEHRLAGGEDLAGAKLGLTSRVKRDALGIQEPVYGWLTTGMLVTSGQPIPLSRLIHPRAEPELAFLIGKGLEPPATIGTVLAATESVCGAIEVVDSRYASRFRLQDSVADNAGAACVVLGSTVRRPSDLVDLKLVGCVFRAAGELVGTAAAGAAMGHPAAAVAWLVNTLGQRGQYLRAGSIVLSGGLTASVPLRPGAVVSAEFDGLGSVHAFASAFASAFA